jgi:hypothetical protein
VKLETKGGFLFLDWLLYNDYGLGSACLWYQLSWLGGYHYSLGFGWWAWLSLSLVPVELVGWLSLLTWLWLVAWLQLGCFGLARLGFG